MSGDPFTTPIARRIWQTKYRWEDGDAAREPTIAATWRRVARALAAVEPHEREVWEQRFAGLLDGFRFLPGGRVLAGAGTDRRVTLFNCFVMGTIDDSMDGIFDALKEGALTMQQGGGVGYDFSTLRPQGMPARGVGTVASGPVSFMRIWDAMCATLLSTGARRGAMMATLRCDHPDIELFVDAKREPRELRHFNLSVLVSDALMAAVRDDRDWPLLFPTDGGGTADGAIIERRWSGRDAAVPCRVVRTVRARALWERIMRANHACAEPGVLFVDRINRMNNLWYRERISATNPCGELPLPPYGACDLGSLNLAAFVRDPFTPKARVDRDALRAATALAVRMLDNVIDASQFPLPQQAAQAHDARRIGLGLTGLADTLIMLGLHYAEPPARSLAARLMQTIRDAAYLGSVALARDKGPFPAFERGRYLEGEFIRALPVEIRGAIARHGIRNSHLTAIAPTGTISLLANNLSSGLEPVYAFSFRRRVREPDGGHREHVLEDAAFRSYRARFPDGPLPRPFVTAAELAPQAHLAMQAALQPFVDSSISKTINVPRDHDFARFKAIYEEAFALGLKGCTTFRPNPVTGSVLSTDDGSAATHCCSLEREAD